MLKRKTLNDVRTIPNPERRYYLHGRPARPATAGVAVLHLLFGTSVQRIKETYCKWTSRKRCVRFDTLGDVAIVVDNLGYEYDSRWTLKATAKDLASKCPNRRFVLAVPLWGETHFVALCNGLLQDNGTLFPNPVQADESNLEFEGMLEIHGKAGKKNQSLWG